MRASGRHTGIVLRNYEPKSSKIALIDKLLGRVDGVVLSSTVCVGSLLHYDVKPGKGVYLLEQVSIDDLPLALARSDLLFLHHVLELCYYFIPIGSCIAGIFELLEFLYTVDYSTCDEQAKKLYVLKLLASIGMYPEVPKKHEQIIGQLLAVPVDMLVHTTLDETQQKIVHDWLCWCVADHPYIEQFNTMRFLMKNGEQ